MNISLIVKHYLVLMHSAMAAGCLGFFAKLKVPLEEEEAALKRLRLCFTH
jgi:hypothetical protein